MTCQRGIHRRQRNTLATEFYDTVGAAKQVEASVGMNHSPVGKVERAGADGRRPYSQLPTVFQRLHAEGQTIVMVTHEPDIAAHAQRMVTLRDGVIESDTVQTPTDARVHVYPVQA